MLKFARLPVLPLAIVAVSVTLAFRGEGWVLTASWVAVGLLAWLADRRMRQAEDLSRAQFDLLRTLEPDSALPAPEAPQMLPAPRPETTPDRLH